MTEYRAVTISSKTILGMENLYNKALQLEKEANNVKLVLMGCVSRKEGKE
ncbi:hypothetical protein [Borrelia persica]